MDRDKSRDYLLEIFFILEELSKKEGCILSFTYKDNVLDVIFKKDKNTTYRVCLKN